MTVETVERRDGWNFQFYSRSSITVWFEILIEEDTFFQFYSRSSLLFYDTESEIIKRNFQFYSRSSLSKRGSAALSNSASFNSIVDHQRKDML